MEKMLYEVFYWQQRQERLHMSFGSDLWGFLKVRKKFWLLPIITILVLLGALVIFGGGSAVAPFIYTLF